MTATYYYKYKHYIIELNGPNTDEYNIKSIYAQYIIKEPHYIITAITSIDDKSIKKLHHKYKKTGCLINKTIHNYFIVGTYFKCELYGSLVYKTYECAFFEDFIYLEQYKMIQGGFNGVYKEWYENGIIHTECFYMNGLKHGTEKEWHINGVLKKETHYINGKINGIVRKWGSNTKLLSETSYINNEKDGTSKEFHGETIFEYNYKNNKLMFIKEWDGSGTLINKIDSENYYTYNLECTYFKKNKYDEYIEGSDKYYIS